MLRRVSILLLLNFAFNGKAADKCLICVFSLQQCTEKKSNMAFFISKETVKSFNNHENSYCCN